jgi:hypothetical protein
MVHLLASRALTYPYAALKQDTAAAQHFGFILSSLQRNIRFPRFFQETLQSLHAADAATRHTFIK